MKKSMQLKRGLKKLSAAQKKLNPEEADIDISLPGYISPIEWSNIFLYGEYKLNRDLVR
ncbi:hypothetical protein C5S42_00170 [Candidatus Methanomarinus sp.]|nr:hypothetical protein C5S42_00170 [ANME-2 cluster archaeon]